MRVRSWRWCRARFPALKPHLKTVIQVVGKSLARNVNAVQVQSTDRRVLLRGCSLVLK